MDLYTIRRELMSGKTIYDLPLRVTYYARVSTDKEEQKNSLESQDIYYKNKILETPMWTLVHGYSDKGITGTSTKKRRDFNDMIADGLNDMYDLILTKEVCRFARNTLDTLQLTRNLLAKGKGVYFELDNINTLEQEGELRLTIMASLAQDESRRISERVKFGFKRSIEKGRVLGNNSIWGYEKNNCKLEINEDEAKIVMERFKKFNIDVIKIDASKKFLGLLENVSDPETKRKIIGKTFIEVFNEEASKIGHFDFLAQGTLYTDVIESGTKTAQTIKSHHNVGGLPKDMPFKLLEPLNKLFKDEVRALGKELDMDDELVNRQPFPGPGLAIRIIGNITNEKIKIVQDSDFILRDEIKKANLDKKIWQYFTVLLDNKSVGVMGDQRSYMYTVAIRAVTSIDGMTADWAKIPYDVLDAISTRIVNEVKNVNRVVLDVTSKPPSTIEWE